MMVVVVVIKKDFAFPCLSKTSSDVALLRCEKKKMLLCTKSSGSGMVEAVIIMGFWIMQNNHQYSISGPPRISSCRRRHLGGLLGLLGLRGGLLGTAGTAGTSVCIRSCGVSSRVMVALLMAFRSLLMTAGCVFGCPWKLLRL